MRRFTAHSLLSSCGLAVLAAACGARTDSLLDGPHAVPSATVAAIPDAGRDVHVPDARPPGTACRVSADCDDGTSCTTDTCQRGKCVATADDARCPATQMCDTTAGCKTPAIMAISNRSILDVVTPSGRTREIATIEDVLPDIALGSDGLLYGGAGKVYALNRVTNRWELDLGPSEITPTGDITTATNALDFGPDGKLYGAGGGRLVIVDARNVSVTRIGSFPSGLNSSGDIAFVGARLFSAAGTGDLTISKSNLLLEFSTVDGTATRIGEIGAPCVHGLAPDGAKLYGFTCSGKILDIDIATGAGKVIAEIPGATFSGATRK